MSYNSDFVDDGAFNNIFQKSDELIIYHKPVNDTIYCFSNDGVLIGSYSLDFGNMKVPPEISNSYEKVIEERRKVLLVFVWVKFEVCIEE